MRASRLPRLVKRILVIHQGALGDFVCALPALKSLRVAFPNAHMTLMGYPRILDLVKDRYYADSIVSVDRAEIASLYQERQDYPASLTDFLGSFQIIGVISWSRHPFFYNLREVSRARVVMIPPRPAQGEAVHMVDHLLSLPHCLGLPLEGDFPRLYLLDSDRNRAVKVLAKHGAAPDDLLVAIHPGSGSRAKNWPMANFLDLASHLVEAYKAQIIFVVGPGEEGIKQDLLGPVRSKRPVILDSLSLPLLGAILERCCGFAGNDSGIAHMAAAVGIPVVTIFGPSDPGRWAPKGEKVSLIRRGLSCSPCGREAMSRCESRQCLTEISVDHVYRALVRAVEKRRDKNASISAYGSTECREPGAIGASP